MYDELSHGLATVVVLHADGPPRLSFRQAVAEDPDGDPPGAVRPVT